MRDYQYKAAVPFTDLTVSHGDIKVGCQTWHCCPRRDQMILRRSSTNHGTSRTSDLNATTPTRRNAVARLETVVGHAVPENYLWASFAVFKRCRLSETISVFRSLSMVCSEGVSSCTRYRQTQSFQLTFAHIHKSDSPLVAHARQAAGIKVFMGWAIFVPDVRCDLHCLPWQTRSEYFLAFSRIFRPV